MCSFEKSSKVGQPAERQVPFGSNSIRLSGHEWLIVAIICSSAFVFGPGLWGRLEGPGPDADCRLSSKLCDDYWFCERYFNRACSRCDTLVVGDSVMRGPHVPANKTLPHYLNELAGRDHFANLGVDGMHPVALTGLLKHYGKAISRKNVVLHLNPLWLTSAKLDLQTDKEFRFYHPKLVPQFAPRISCYKDSFSKRVSAAVERNTAFLGWASHLRIAYLDNMDLSAWTMEHPHANPVAALAPRPPAPEDQPPKATSWLDKGAARQDFQWVEPAKSFQWRYFQRLIELLKRRGNTVFVLVGPFNEHMLEPASLETYRKVKLDIEAWLRQNNVPYYLPEPLPSEFYSDASHPLAEGYALLARRLFENESFKSTILRTPGDPIPADPANPGQPAP